ncbi:putative inorganic phosphate cotransporter [Thelohanellus kitauei]|uniref:Putative inorganic phosphate cotransporter n=1 Tax=Thelohanellus kitauei TaxID=669202 RepID=A0A0C2J6J3_THEKT|nr:putative inorganic phosphate cotransporter [Thelohanellus kitauei]
MALSIGPIQSDDQSEYWNHWDDKRKGIKQNTDIHLPCSLQQDNDFDSNRTEKFEWSESMQNYVLLAYNVEYMIGHVPGAFLSIKFRYRRIMIFCLGASTILTIASVFVAPYQWVFFGIRSLIGLVNGPLYPIVHETIAGHSPSRERTFLTLFTHTGNLVSLALILPIGGLFINNFINGWKYVFFLSGGLGVLATSMWTLFVYSEHDENPWMSEFEQKYITSQIYPQGKPPNKTMKNVPFLHLLNSISSQLSTLENYLCFT